MNLTHQQQDFIDAVMTGGGHLCLRARAGTGKTATILAAARAAVADGFGIEVSICAFGKNIQTEISGKLKSMGVDWRAASAVTTHSMGFSAVRGAIKNVVVDADKVKKMIRAEAERDKGLFRYAGQIGELVHLAKLEGFGVFEDLGIDDDDAWAGMIEHYGLPEDALELVAAARHFYRMSAARPETIDFDDMVLLPLLLDLPVAYRKDIIFLDEAQDTSRARRALVKMFLKPHGRLMIVGDDRQAIMGFAGASSNALDELVEEMDAKVLPLTTTWRCPKKVVALAQELVPDIEAAAGAAEGVVGTVHRFPLASEMRPTDAILCRNTAPLVKQAYALIRAGVACKVEGRDIGAGLIKMLGKWKEITTITPYLDRLAQWEEHEVRRAFANGAEERIPEIYDRVSTLRVVCDAVSENHKEELSDVRDFVAGLFADDVKGMGMTTLATMHRSKGREWQRTMLLDYHYYCPSPYAKKDWQMRQEENLMYVGITRAMEELTFVRTQKPRPRHPGWTDEDSSR